MKLTTEYMVEVTFMDGITEDCFDEIIDLLVENNLYSMNSPVGVGTLETYPDIVVSGVLRLTGNIMLLSLFLDNIDEVSEYQFFEVVHD